MKSRLVIGLAAIVLLAGAATAADGKKKQGKKRDSLVCETVTVTGSRLAKKQICVTRSYGEQARTSQRRVVEQAQVNRQSFF
ncbi:MAG TPA: hypothetical protein VGW34_00455 [Allosphingosinicella sp.]|nr:hypothetical protein [Allosphingosinicella sp.]